MHAIYTERGKKDWDSRKQTNASKKGVCGLNVEKQQRLEEVKTRLPFSCIASFDGFLKPFTTIFMTSF